MNEPLIAKYARLLKQDSTLQKLGLEEGSELQKRIDAACVALDKAGPDVLAVLQKRATATAPPSDASLPGLSQGPDAPQK